MHSNVGEILIKQSIIQNVFINNFFYVFYCWRNPYQAKYYTERIHQHLLLCILLLEKSLSSKVLYRTYSSTSSSMHSIVGEILIKQSIIQNVFINFFFYAFYCWRNPHQAKYYTERIHQHLLLCILLLEKSLSSEVLYRTYSSTTSSMYSIVGEILIKQSIIQNVFINNFFYVFYCWRNPYQAKYYTERIHQHLLLCILLLEKSLSSKVLYRTYSSTSSSMYSIVGEILIKQSIIQNVFINIFFYVFYCWRNPHQAKYYTERIHQHLLLCILLLEKSLSSKVLYRTYSSTSSMYSIVGEILIKQSIIQNVFINIFYVFYCWRNPYQAKYYTERIHQHLLLCILFVEKSLSSKVLYRTYSSTSSMYSNVGEILIKQSIIQNVFINNFFYVFYCWRNPYQTKYYTERIHQHLLLCILLLGKSSSSKVLYRTYSSTSSSMHSIVGEILIKQSIIQNVFINIFFYAFYCWRYPHQAKYYTERIHQHLLLCILLLEKSLSSEVLYRTYSSTISSMYSIVGEILIKQSIIQNVFINIFFYAFYCWGNPHQAKYYTERIHQQLLLCILLLEKSSSSKVLYRTYSSTTSSMYSIVGEILIKQSIIQNVFINIFYVFYCWRNPYQAKYYTERIHQHLLLCILLVEKSLSSKVLYRTYSSTSSMYSNVGEILIKQSIIQNVFINNFFYVFYCWRNPYQAKYYTERIHQHLLCILMLEKSSSSKVLYRTYSSTTSSMYSIVGEILIKQSIIQNVFINIFFYVFYCWRNPYQAKYYTERIHQHLLLCILLLEKSSSSEVLYRTYSSTSSSMYSIVGEILIKQSIIQNVFINIFYVFYCWRNPYQAKYYTERIHQHLLLCILLLEKSSSSKVLYRTYSSTSSSMYSIVGEILIKQSIIQNVFINIFFYVFYCWRNPHQAKYYTERIHQHLLLCILLLEKSSSSKVLYRTYSSTSSSMYSIVGEILIKQSIIQNVFINIFFYVFYCWRNPYQAKYYTDRIHQHLLCILMLEKSSSSKVLYRTYSSRSSSMYSIVGEILIKQSIIQNVFINIFFYVFYCWRNPYQAKYYTERIHQHLLLCILLLEKSLSSEVLYRTYSSTSYSMYSNVGEILIKQSIIQNVFINIFFYVFYCWRNPYQAKYYTERIHQHLLLCILLLEKSLSSKVLYRTYSSTSSSMYSIVGEILIK